jgi:two-component system chemotaxis response regulator CheY
MDMQGDTDIAQLKLPAVLDLAAADGFLETMRSRALAGSRLQIDASAVETLTLPCIQIILAALQSDALVSIGRPSEAFVSAFRDLGLNWSDACEPSPETEGFAAGPEAVDDQICPSPDTPTEEILMTKRILTIDDSKTIRDMLKLTLLDAGFEVSQAVDGQDGVDILSKEQFDVVITDINMPKMDGYEVIRHMRGNSDHKSTPILVLTTESETEKRNLAREAGATGWMVKPFDPEQLVATINKVAP